jgi:hypothetical protein
MMPLSWQNRIVAFLGTLLISSATRIDVLVHSGNRLHKNKVSKYAINMVTPRTEVFVRRLREKARLG